jgi:hypothetical protein
MRHPKLTLISMLIYQNFRGNMDNETKKVYNVLLGILSVIIAGIIIFVSYELVSYKHQPKIYQLPADSSIQSTRTVTKQADNIQKTIQQKADETWIKMQEQIWEERAKHLRSMQDKEGREDRESKERSKSEKR